MTACRQISVSSRPARATQPLSQEEKGETEERREVEKGEEEREVGGGRKGRKKEIAYRNYIPFKRDMLNKYIEPGIVAHALNPRT